MIFLLEYIGETRQRKVGRTQTLRIVILRSEQDMTHRSPAVGGRAACYQR